METGTDGYYDVWVTLQSNSYRMGENKMGMRKKTQLEPVLTSLIEPMLDFGFVWFTHFAITFVCCLATCKHKPTDKSKEKKCNKLMQIRYLSIVLLSTNRETNRCQ